MLSQGADHAVNHGSDGYLEDVKRLAGGNGPQLILEMLADVNLGHDLGIIAPGGRIVIVGCRGEATINPRLLMAQDADIRGVMIWNASADTIRAIAKDLVAAANEGAIHPVVGREFPLADAAAAHTAVIAGGNGGNVVLIP